MKLFSVALGGVVMFHSHYIVCLVGCKVGSAETAHIRAILLSQSIIVV